MTATAASTMVAVDTVPTRRAVAGPSRSCSPVTAVVDTPDDRRDARADPVETVLDQAVAAAGQLGDLGEGFEIDVRPLADIVGQRPKPRLGQGHGQSVHRGTERVAFPHHPIGREGITGQQELLGIKAHQHPVLLRHAAVRDGGQALAVDALLDEIGQAKSHFRSDHVEGLPNQAFAPDLQGRPTCVEGRAVVVEEANRLIEPLDESRIRIERQEGLLCSFGAFEGVRHPGCGPASSPSITKSFTAMRLCSIPMATTPIALFCRAASR